MSYESGPEGVGGWLVFFLVTLGIFTPLGLIVGTAATFADPTVAAAYGSIYGTLVAAEWAFVAFVVALCWIACFMFLRVFRPVTKWVGIGILWTIALASVLGEPVLVSAIAGIDLQLILQEMGAQLIRPFFYAGIWTAYLLISKRVANTYSGIPHADDAGEVFA